MWGYLVALPLVDTIRHLASNPRRYPLTPHTRNYLATHSVADSLNLLSYPGSSSGFVVHKNSYIYLGPIYESTSSFFCYVLQLLLTSASRNLESITIT
jgi:hypothetical protein